MRSRGDAMRAGRRRGTLRMHLQGYQGERILLGLPGDRIVISCFGPRSSLELGFHVEYSR